MKKIKITLLSILAFLGIFLAVFYFLNFDFKGTKDSISSFFCKKTTCETTGIPVSWLNRYDIKLSAENTEESDHDGDGLSLLDEYLNSTNPLNPDTDGDGYTDGKEVRDGYSPIGSGKLDRDQDGLPDFWEEKTGLDTKTNDFDSDNDGDSLSNHLEFLHLTDPLKADTDDDGFNDFQEIANGYDPTIAGDIRPELKISIEKINVEAPIVWSQSNNEKSLLKDLEFGISRLPDTGIPGQTGNTVLSGHSSNYVWAKGGYNYIFKDIGNLENGDKIIIHSTNQKGKTIKYTYLVKMQKVVKSFDPLIFTQNDSSEITLVTCWPLGTTWKRLIVKAELEEKLPEQPEQKE